MVNISDLTNYLINYPDLCVDNLKLQKLLFYCQAVTLVKTGKPLFSDKIEAWEYGPVIPTVYRKYKKFDGKITEEKREGSISPDDINCIDMAVEYYGEMSEIQLINSTHSEKPWKDAYAKGHNTEITTDSMMSFYKTTYSFK